MSADSISQNHCAEVLGAQAAFNILPHGTSPPLPRYPPLDRRTPRCPLPVQVFRSQKPRVSSSRGAFAFRLTSVRRRPGPGLAAETTRLPYRLEHGTRPRTSRARRILTQKRAPALGGEGQDRHDANAAGKIAQGRASIGRIPRIPAVGNGCPRRQPRVAPFPPPKGLQMRSGLTQSGGKAQPSSGLETRALFINGQRSNRRGQGQLALLACLLENLGRAVP